jgi:hypothetical protein
MDDSGHKLVACPCPHDSEIVGDGDLVPNSSLDDRLKGTDQHRIAEKGPGRGAPQRDQLRELLIAVRSDSVGWKHDWQRSC